jgi:phospholipid/cholesterol/gamma-HCH transport system substrate-binding protein
MKKRTELAVGIVSLIAIVILILGISFGRGLGVSNVEIKLRFPNSGGIQLTSPVLVNGVKRGSVTAIENNKGSVLIAADLDNINDIFSDATARITILEITGGKKIEIFPGTSGAKFDTKDEISGQTPADIADLVAIGGSMVNDISTLIKRIDSIAYSVNSVLVDGKTVNAIKNTFYNADKLTSNLNELLNKNIVDINASIKNIKIISNDVKSLIQRNDPKVSKLLDELQLTLDNTKKLISKTENTVSGADLLIEDINSITKEIKSGKGSIGKLIYDPVLAVKLDSAVVSLSELLKLLNLNGINVNVRLGTRP